MMSHPILIRLAPDYHFGGLNPFMDSATNLLQHLMNTLVVFWFFCLLIKRKNPL